MEPYQYWALAGFILLSCILFTKKSLPLVLSGSFFFAAVAGYKFPDNFTVQIITFFVFIPIIFLAIKHNVKNKCGG